MGNNRKYILLGLILIIASIVVYSLYSWRKEQITTVNAPQIGGRFVPTTSSIPLSEDEIQASRLLRGITLSFNEEGVITLSTFINWPDRIQRTEIEISTSEQTQYLCWPSVQVFNGQEVNISDSHFFLSDTTRLELVGQTFLDSKEARAMLSSSPKEVLIGLQQSYNRLGDNIAYQVAIIGCQDEQ